jgi:hypothetical protein
MIPVMLVAVTAVRKNEPPNQEGFLEGDTLDELETVTTLLTEAGQPIELG